MAKKNIRKIPKLVHVQLKRLNERYIVAACLKIVSSQQLLQGELKHLGIHLSNEELIVPEDPAVPPVTSGKYSRRNIDGYAVIRKDLPKETHYNSVECPNYGDWYNGSHRVDLPYRKYPRDFYGPEHICVKINTKEKGKNKKQYVLTFELDSVLDRKDPNFERDLLKCLNILQENIGMCGVQKANASFNDYLQTTKVDWIILPPGTREEVVDRIFAGYKSPVPEEKKKTAGERYDFFKKLRPKKLVYGMSGIQRYFGALLEKDLVVFENVEYGNAIYIMYSNWQELSKCTRTELLSGRHGKEFNRVPHISGWKDKVEHFVERSRKKNKERPSKS